MTAILVSNKCRSDYLCERIYVDFFFLLQHIMTISSRKKHTTCRLLMYIIPTFSIWCVMHALL
nr:MAG TPA: hypothetical protein [Caudoviricetes sp.]